MRELKNHSLLWPQGELYAHMQSEVNLHPAVDLQVKVVCETCSLEEIYSLDHQ